MSYLWTFPVGLVALFFAAVGSTCGWVAWHLLALVERRHRRRRRERYRIIEQRGECRRAP